MHWKQFCRYFYVRGNLDTEKLVHPKFITHLPTSSGRRVDGICQKLIGGGSQKSWPTHWSSFLKFHVIGPYVVFSTPPPFLLLPFLTQRITHFSSPFLSLSLSQRYGPYDDLPVLQRPRCCSSLHPSLTLPWLLRLWCCHGRLPGE
jgi:hypothetical protein